MKPLFQRIPSKPYQSDKKRPDPFAFPTREGDAPPWAHNVGNTNSQYTSWTTSREIADEAANADGPGGVTLVDREHPDNLVKSPDIYGESEVLREGKITGAKPETPLPENRPSWFDRLEEKDK